MPAPNSVDALDARILLALDDDPEASILSLSRTLGIARNTVHARLRRMTDGGVLRAFSRRVSPTALGYPLTAFLSLALNQRIAGETRQAMLDIPEIVEMHAISGDHDVLIKVVARDTGDLHRLTHRILAIDGVLRSSTAISLEEQLPTRLRALLEVAAAD
ncbi:Lrp/AsnC family transcriptional regulator [Agromyces seonyuensis]|uniref:Winged helix-turn-helix transcriptional regulator n=1 Tax=Agromyces seonyuensis TaxID=2662446 RepID=A0A6I4P4H8_9MICO|nr:Lrp/AsnC family transcriptional regulator [Agromyces seonyuensis]MWB99815.1 winged helix-turn-helix transcriptional regulator [Agromyces seonyuensis]